MARPWGTRKVSCHLELRAQDYLQLEMTAKRVCKKLHPALRQQVYLEDLIDWGWARVFSSCKTYADWERWGRYNCMREMANYAKYLYEQTRRVCGERWDDSLAEPQVLSRDLHLRDTEMDARAILESLPSPIKMLAKLRYWDNLSYEEISKRMKMGRNAVRKLLHEGLAAVRDAGLCRGEDR